MRNRLVLLAALTGCGFRAPGGAVIDPDAADPDGEVIADAPTVDAAPDARPDAPIDAPPCADVDNDDVCDSTDIWLCGPEPQMPSNAVTLDDQQSGNHQTTTLTGTSLGPTGKVRTVAPGAQFTVSANTSILDCICQGCIDQIQIGLVPGTAKKCIYDGNPPCQSSAMARGT